MTSARQPVTRKCAGCGYRSRSFAGEEFCSAVCVGSAGMQVVMAGLHRLAEQHPPPFGTPHTPQ